MNVLTALLLAGVIQGFLLSIVLITIGKRNRTANRILASIIVIFTVCILVHSLAHSDYFFDIPYHPQFMQLLFFMLGPLIYFYVRALTESDFLFRKKAILHFIPFAAASLIFISIFLSSATDPLGEHISIFNVSSVILTVVLVTCIVIYMVLSIMKLQAHSRNIEHSFSSLEKINLDWLKLLLSGILITWIVAIILEIFSIRQSAWDYVWLLVSFFIYLIGYMGLRQPVIFTGTESTSSLEKGTRKYERSTLTPESADEYLKRLLEIMETEKPYLDTDITLGSLASKLAVSVHHLSRVINEKLKLNFFEMINKYRVEEAKRLISDPQYRNINIASIGLDAGFNSISAFNTAFKKHTGSTPSQFRTSVSGN
ncbi:MAG: helix-turn-helix transcriptional regulator [bacterium]|nr:helix-turn-helix transcriptional regulator [bacterium]